MDSHARGALLMLATLSLGTGCTALNSSSPGFNAHQTAADARCVLSQRVPPGTPVADALQALGQDGFQCRREGTADAPAHRHVCTLSSPRTPGDATVTAAPTPVTWFVTLDSANGTTVSTLDVQRLPGDVRAR
jgi:hypothetical protein